MSDRRLGVAVIGSGMIANTAHIPSWVARTDSELLWVVDSRADAARETAQRWGVARWTTDYREALSDSAVQAVDICTSAFVHAEQTLAALAAGKHVLVEKPLATSMADAQSMEHAALASDRVVMVTENWLFATATRRVKRLIDEGVLGDLFMIQASNENDFMLAEVSRPGVADRDRLGYAFVGGIHTLAVARHLMGEFDRISAFANANPDVAGLNVLYDTEMAISARFRSGAVGSIHLIGRAPHQGRGLRSFRVFGTGGWAEFDVFSGLVSWTDGKSTKTESQYRSSAGHPESIEHFIECVREQREPLTSVTDQMRSLEVVHAAYQSARQGETVTFEPQEVASRHA
jgi:predicted dehydrogenase